MVLLTSALDSVGRPLADRVAEVTGCQVVEVGAEPLKELKPMVEEKKLGWKDVAFMGKRPPP